MWSPRTRGWSAPEHQHPDHAEVVPAPAGVAPGRRTARCATSRVPRPTRGWPRLPHALSHSVLVLPAMRG
ncbi:hypothetical protein FRZ00_05015 [Streptomyces mobaraensis]|uniref:Uncharacterized protein n=1 Tax=Streptomyces mobaraensis TaxID=35621 RepID=A0A5N5WCJ4_STRMB|nr:hypothetical protein FRZ00_05015 [Streptomyces mobaraensis]